MNDSYVDWDNINNRPTDPEAGYDDELDDDNERLEELDFNDE